MQLSRQARQLVDFVQHNASIRLFSTHADIVSFTGVLYNVDGSSDDPEIDGYNWRNLLRERGINGNCYVTNVQPPGTTSHPNFSVGGHMTVNQDGRVPVGGDCYLMPLCSWHNSKSRDGIAFEHVETRMLKLFGYMQDEPLATFSARMASNEKFALVPLAEREGVGLFSPPRLGDLPAEMFKQMAQHDAPEFYVLLQQHEEDGQKFYQIEDAKLPGGG